MYKVASGLDSPAQSDLSENESGLLNKTESELKTILRT